MGSIDEVNRVAWGSPRTVGVFVGREGLISAGEASVMRRLGIEARDQPILDIGVGGGRTTGLLREVSADYVGIDYLGSLVAAARARFPQARIEQVDARDLSCFGDGTFAAVVFSLNGIDGVSHADRQTILSEVHRVLRPGGLFAYSTHNLDYRLAGRREWRSDLQHLGRHPVRAVVYAMRLPNMHRRRRRLGTLADRGDGWAAIPDLAYGHPVIWHHVTVVEAVRELHTSGLAAEIEVYTSSGTRVVGNAVGIEQAVSGLRREVIASRSLHILARK